jgi:nitroreductase
MKTATKHRAKCAAAWWRFCGGRVLASIRVVPLFNSPPALWPVKLQKHGDGSRRNEMLNEWLTRVLQLKALPFGAAIAKLPNMIHLNDTSSIRAFLKSRKSASAKAMTGPGPSAEQLSEILDIAVRVPDHGKLNPWRFILFEGEARAKVGQGFADIWKKLHPDHGEDSLAFQRGLFMRAPVVLAVVSTAAPHAKIPVWEQQLSSAAVCYNAVLAATAMGFAAQWQTDWVAYDAAAKLHMGLNSAEQVAGLIYIGQSSTPLEDRPRPDASVLLTHWGS